MGDWCPDLSEIDKPRYLAIADAIDDVFDLMVAQRLEQRPVVPHVAMDGSKRPAQGGHVSRVSVQIIIVADDCAASAKELPDNCRSNESGSPRDHYGPPSQITHSVTPLNANQR